ncbi:MAG: Na+/galactose cotransporter [Ignavibacteria bacterium RIFOXYB2_FULL_35_12]|nr:MAG: Na+/galactose cotransporter [Ignavibacteria bacterium GWA2_36_19]OGU51936.1 MAG: Na+/galactose cotransporter [Ignavibacteria bacterium GWC2_35_8]OGU56662.1 MAG: Na+/galactose cotransporter [Ignavibacteria bacterium GWF2_35_20]OGU81389.1 MAG: Na+/galactose cotransporter [Ignavibacteria bacterium RIFOXYA2_FULL_35_9]OGU86353.1 MAG: Na+/galactose cotransporter [Ignavibacteria bacterium RIFOXYA12_FULL_35_25]OGU87801.1 MAG: Na+/galactose cotransporter [Ignavibacteria bacterium RIFOXYC12_FULL
MQSIGLSIVDWIIILIYFAFVLGIGWYLRKFTTTKEDFFLAGRKNSSWVAGLAFLSANLGALELLGMTGNTFKYGMYVAHFYWIGAIPAMLFLGIYMMPFYYSSKINSVPGYLKLRFDEKTRVLNGIAFAIMTLLVSGINLYAMALVLHTFLGWNWDISMWVSAITVACYVGLSGLMSAIFTEIIQFFMIWFGLFLVSILGIIEIGSMKEIFARINEYSSQVSFTTLWSTASDPTQNGMFIHWSGIVLGLGFVLSFGYWTTDFLVVQRAFSAKDLRSARMTPILASFFKMALPFLVILAGLIAIALSIDPNSGFKLLEDGGQINYDSALPLLIARYYPSGLVGLGVTALLAGFMAGQAGNISAFNTVWTYDIYKSVLNRKASDAHLLWMGRASTIVGVIISLGTAYWAKSFPSIMDYMQAIFSWVNAPLFATMLLGMFVWWITPNGAFWGLVAGMSSSFFMWLAVKFHWFSESIITLSNTQSDMAANFWRAWWAWSICAAITIVVSLITKRRPKEELVGLVKGLTEEKHDQHLPFVKHPEFAAIISLIILALLNIWFW